MDTGKKLLGAVQGPAPSPSPPGALPWLDLPVLPQGEEMARIEPEPPGLRGEAAEARATKGWPGPREAGFGCPLAACPGIPP